MGPLEFVECNATMLHPTDQTRRLGQHRLICRVGNGVWSVEVRARFRCSLSMSISIHPHVGIPTPTLRIMYVGILALARDTVSIHSTLRK